MPTDHTAESFVAALNAHRSSVDLERSRRWFRTDDEFIGARMGEVFRLAKEFVDLPPSEIDKLLASPVHEVRVGAVSIMGKQAIRRRTAQARRKELFELYLARVDRINTWDLVDVSAHQVIGGYPTRTAPSSTGWPAQRTGGNGGSPCTPPCG